MSNDKIYGRTTRLGENTWEWLITEKLDGSNLGFYRYNGELYIAQSKHIFNWRECEECEEMRTKMYPGLWGWLEQNAEDLEGQLYEGSIIFGEWLGMGAIKYPNGFPRFNMFAKARWEGDREGSTWRLERFNYDPNDFHYVFASNEIPEYIGVVPVVERTQVPPTVEYCDRLYAEYAAKVGRPVEGFVISQKPVQDNRCKYVRFKRGKLTPHDTEEMMAERRKKGLARKEMQQRQKHEEH